MMKAKTFAVNSSDSPVMGTETLQEETQSH